MYLVATLLNQRDGRSFLFIMYLLHWSLVFMCMYCIAYNLKYQKYESTLDTCYHQGSMLTTRTWTQHTHKNPDTMKLTASLKNIRPVENYYITPALYRRQNPR